MKRGVWQPWKRQLSILVCVLGIGGLVLGVASCDLFNRPPVATFSIGPSTTGTAPFTVFLTGTSTDPDGDDLVYTWKFGDGSLDAEGEVLERAFTQVGTWTITLIVTDSHGASDQTQMDVYVTAAAPAGPTAEFTVTPTSGTAPLSVTVDASGSTYSVAAINSYAWAFGDGQTGFGRTASHMYISSSTQTYTITLTVTAADGKTGRATKQVRVTASGGGTSVAGNPSAQFVITTDEQGVAPLQVSFDPTDSEAANGRSLILYAWTYDDGVAESDPGAALKTHVFSTKTSSEVFSVMLLVMDNASASDSITKTVKVYNYRPIAGFEIANPPGGHGTGDVQYLTTGVGTVWETENVVYGNLGTLQSLSLTTVRVWIRSKEIVDAGGAGSANRWFTLSGGPTVTQHNLRTATTSAVSGGAPSAPTGYTENNFSYDPEGQTWTGGIHPTWFPVLADQAWGIKWLYINWGDASPIEQVPYVAIGGITEDHDYPIANAPTYTITVTAEDYLGYQSAPFSRTVTLKTGIEAAGDI